MPGLIKHLHKIQNLKSYYFMKISVTKSFQYSYENICQDIFKASETVMELFIFEITWLSLWLVEGTLDSYQIVNLVKQLIHLLAVHQTNMTFAQKSSHLALQFELVHIQHHHYRHQIVQHRWKKTILVMLQPLAFCITERVVPEVETV